MFHWRFSWGINYAIQTRFPCDENGKYNIDGKYRKEKKLLTVKFPKQGWFYFGVVIVDRSDGAAGERAELFGYTCCKNIVYTKQFEDMIKTAIWEVKKLTRDTKGWHVSNR